MGADIHMYAEVYDETTNEWVLQKNKFYNWYTHKMVSNHLQEYFGLTNKQCIKVIDYFYSGKKSRNQLEWKIINEYLPNSLKEYDDWDGILSLGNLPHLLIDEVYIYRNYQLFGILNDVRSYGDIHIVEDYDRGLPDDITEELHDMYLLFEDDSHSPSYLFLDEIIESDIHKNKKLSSGVKFFLKKCVNSLKKLDNNYKNVRVVFWFDN